MMDLKASDTLWLDRLGGALKAVIEAGQTARIA
jgi:hypothetical protein